MAYETILYEKENGVGTITLNRPQALNAFVPQMNKEVLEALKDGERDDERDAKNARQRVVDLPCK